MADMKDHAEWQGREPQHWRSQRNGAFREDKTIAHMVRAFSIDERQYPDAVHAEQ